MRNSPEHDPTGRCGFYLGTLHTLESKLGPNLGIPQPFQNKNGGNSMAAVLATFYKFVLLT